MTASQEVRNTLDITLQQQRDDINCVVVSWNQITLQNSSTTKKNVAEPLEEPLEDGEIAPQQSSECFAEKNSQAEDFFDLSEALKSFSANDPLARELHYIQETCSRQGRSLKKEGCSRARVVSNSKQKTSPPKTKSTKKAGGGLHHLSKILSTPLKEGNKDSFDNELRSYSIQSSMNRKNKDAFNHSLKHHKKRERQRSRSNDRSSTGSYHRTFDTGSYHWKQQEASEKREIYGNKDGPRTSAVNNVRRKLTSGKSVNLLERHQRDSERKSNTKRKILVKSETYTESRKRKRGIETSVSCNRIATNIEDEPVRKRRIL